MGTDTMGNAAEEARRWLAECGVTQVGDGWVDAEEPGRLLTSGDVAHSWAAAVFDDDLLDVPRRLRLAFGLLDLLDDYWVTCEIRFADRGPQGPLPPYVLWDCYRRRLEAERESEALTYSLWVDWFEDRATAATAFAEVLGDDIGRVVDQPSEALLRRARRVLACSGPVPWPVKEAALVTAARLRPCTRPSSRPC